MENSSLDEVYQKRRIRKISILILSIIITGIVLIVETYAWFVGITTVNVSEFNVSISGAEGLELSLNATTNSWTSSTLNITKSVVTSAYTGNTNKWVQTASGEGLTPISTSGEIQSPGALKLFGKSGLASTAGGYKLIATDLGNVSGGVISEKDGYIAFDLFIRNGKNNAYSETYNYDADEAIYLNKNSYVSVAPAGSGSTPRPSGTWPSGDPTNANGVANSVRIAFAQIGRIKASGTEASAAQGLSCSSTTPATSLCSNNLTTIWEPNDKKHDSGLLNYFNNKACKTKTSATTYSSSACHPANVADNGQVAYPNGMSNNLAFRTYTVGQNVSAGNNVDIYDGHNGYSASIGSATYLRDTDTFTDTEKILTGDQRPEFFRLAANSITKVRVYIYLEGQDLDNYDLITKGKAITIKFGFTKDKFEINPSSSPLT